MHEYQSTKSLFEKTLRQAQNMRVKNVYLALGEIAELDQSNVRTQWAELSKGTSLERAGLYFRLIKAEAQCMACFKKYQPPGGKIHCPNCGSFGAKILTGEEFYVECIETDSE